MAEDNKRTDKKANSLRSASTYSESTGRSANKSRSLREETYRPADPNKPGPQTIYLDSEYITYRNNPEPEEETITNDTAEPAEPKAKKEPKGDSLLTRFKDKFSELKGDDTSETTGSSYKRQQVQQAARNELLKKGIIGLIILIVLILVIILIANSCQVKDVGEISIESTATTQTLQWSGARRGLTYEVYRAEGNNGQYKLIDTLTEGENSRTYDNLTAGTLYKYNIITVKGNGSKTEGTMAQDYTKPNAVTGVSATTLLGENTLTVIWNLQGNTSTYELKYGLYDNLRDATTVYFTSNDAGYDDASGMNYYTIENLVENETYYLSMRTVCEGNASEWSSTINATVTNPQEEAVLNADQPMVALTFDGGPDGGTVTERILNVLAANNSKATFFQTGINAEYYPDMMKRIVSEGHEMGNHTYDESHVGDEVTADDILNANTSIEAACGVSPKLFRATQGVINDDIVACCKEAGMAIVLFNFDSHDWELYDADLIVERIQTYVEDGDIIQFRNIYDETADAIETLVPYLIEQGYQLVTVSELIQAKTGDLPSAGTVYVSGNEYE